MTSRILALLGVGVLMSAFALAQGNPPAKTATKPATAAPGVPDKAMLQHILDGWASMNMDNVIKYYDQAPSDVFYDVSPLKYVSFKEYIAGAKQMFSTLSSLKFTLNDDAAVHSAGSLAWATATVKTVMTDKAGKATNLDCRWTAIWQKKGSQWVIVHDHFSAPMAAQ